MIIARYLNLAFKICLVGIPVAFLDYFLADGAHLGTDEVMLAVFIITGTLSLLISYRLKKRYTD